MDTRLAAFEAIQPFAASIRERIYNIIAASPQGVSNYDLVTSYGFKHQTATARVNELMKAGRIQDSGGRTLTGSGRKAILWEANDA